MYKFRGRLLAQSFHEHSRATDAQRQPAIRTARLGRLRFRFTSDLEVSTESGQAQGFQLLGAAEARRGWWALPPPCVHLMAGSHPPLPPFAGLRLPFGAPGRPVAVPQREKPPVGRLHPASAFHPGGGCLVPCGGGAVPAGWSLLLQPRVQGIPQPIAQEVEGHHGQRDGHARGHQQHRL